MLINLLLIERRKIVTAIAYCHRCRLQKVNEKITKISKMDRNAGEYSVGIIYWYCLGLTLSSSFALRSINIEIREWE